ncbi:MAG: hypothetical protein RIT46_168 [Pseudomonadota bacterium]|jgi:hypothetical protein
MDRRVLMGGIVASSAFSAARAMQGYGIVTPGVDTWSESLMLLHFDPEGRNGISVRVSRYPDLNCTWVWCHVLLDGQMYAYTERRLPCSSTRNLGTAAVGDYSSTAARVAFTRSGSVDQMQDIRLSAKVLSRQSSEGRDGSGDVPIVVHALFRPEKLKANPPPGRSEWTGHAEVDLVVGKRRISLKGVAKAHEQTQTAPRFDLPFTYAMMWSPTGSFIATSTSKKRFGNFEADGIAHAVTDFQPSHPDRERHFTALLDDGKWVQGVASRVAAYDVPVFGRVWNGNIVRANVGGRPMVGMLNDWRPQDQVFE